MRLRRQILAFLLQFCAFAGFCCAPALADPTVTAPLVDRVHLAYGDFGELYSHFSMQTFRAAFDVTPAVGVELGFSYLHVLPSWYPPATVATQSLRYRTAVRYHWNYLDLAAGAWLDTAHPQSSWDFGGYIRVSTRFDYGWFAVSVLDGPEVPITYETARVTWGLSGVNAGLPLDGSLSLLVFHNSAAPSWRTPVADLDLAVGLNIVRVRGVVHLLPATQTLLLTLGINDFSTQTKGDRISQSSWQRPSEKPDKVAYTSKKLAQNNGDEQKMPERHRDFFRLFTTGRQITWTLDGMASGKTSQTCLVVQRRDVRVENQISALIRLQCDDGLAEEDVRKGDDALLLRTGCHILDNAGLWRLPRCPDASGSVGLQRRSLVVASEALFASVYARFFEFTSRQVEHKMLKSNGIDVEAACFANPVAGILKMCVSDDDGLLWAQGKDKSVLRLTAIAETQVPPEEDKRFSSLNDNDLRCSLHSSCTAFGLCHSHSTPAPVEIKTEPSADLPAEPTPAVGKPGAKSELAVAQARATLAEARLKYWTARAEAAEKTKPKPDIISCVALGDGDCRAAFICGHNGNCFSKAGACIAKSDEDCRQSSKCRNDGQCQVVGESCAAIAGDSCKTAPSCRALGRCTFRGSSCVVGGDADCQLQESCATDGFCGAFANTCIAVSDEHCALSIACSAGGRCKALGGVCVK